MRFLVFVALFILSSTGLAIQGNSFIPDSVNFLWGVDASSTFYGPRYVHPDTPYKITDEKMTWTEALGVSIYRQFNQSEKDLELGLLLFQLLKNNYRDRQAEVRKFRREFYKRPFISRFWYFRWRPVNKIILETHLVLNLWIMRDPEDSDQVFVATTQADSAGPTTDEPWLTVDGMNFKELDIEVEIDEVVQIFWTKVIRDAKQAADSE